MRLPFLAIAVVALWVGEAQAETDIGNGGDALVCTASGAKTYEAFDAFEARELWELPPDFGPDQSDPFVMAAYAVERLRRLDVSRATRLTTLLQRFLSEARFLTDVSLNDVSDTDSRIIPENCDLEQLVIQYKNPARRMPRYIVDKDLWEKLDSTSQAYMLLHEVLYNEAILRDARDSRGTRIFNAYLASSVLATWSQQDYWRFLEERTRNFPAIVEHGGFHLRAASLQYYPSGEILSGLTRDDIGLDPVRVRQGPRILMPSQYNSPAIVFHPDGTVAEAKRDVEFERQNGMKTTIPNLSFSQDTTGEVLVRGEGSLRYEQANGCIASIDFQDGVRFGADNSLQGLDDAKVALYQGSIEDCGSGTASSRAFAGDLEFYPSWALKQGRLLGPREMMMQDGTVRMVPGNSLVVLAEDGLVISVAP